jgi:parallel beta-helix repeat protein
MSYKTISKKEENNKGDLERMWKKKKRLILGMLCIILLLTSGNLIAQSIQNSDEYLLLKHGTFRNYPYSIYFTGSVYTVNKMDEASFKSIQSAINNAEEGDTVIVKPGMYREQIIIDKSIRLIGEDKNTTIIDGGGVDDVVTIIADEILLCGFTIQNGKNRYNHYAISMKSNNSMIMDTIITDNYNGINLLFSSQTTITDIKFHNNEGNAMNLYQSSYNMISSNIIHNNDYAMRLSESTNNMVINNQIYHQNMNDITLSHASDNSIISNILTDNILGGINIYHSNGNLLSKNTLVNTEEGISLHNCTQTMITSNNITDCPREGVSLSASVENTVYGNILQENRGCGVLLIYESENNSIIENTISKNRKGLCIDHSINNTILRNVFQSTGITIEGDRIEHWTSQTINNNLLNGKLIQYYSNSADTIIPHNTGQVILVNCTRFTIQDLNLSNVDIGIQLMFSSGNIIRNNTIRNNDIQAIDLYHSSSNLIQGNTIKSSKSIGINLFYASKNMITDNNLDSNKQAIYLSHSTENDIIVNIISNHQSGIILFNSTDNTVKENTIVSCSKSGIYLHLSSFNDIIMNSIYDSEEGIRIWWSKYNMFSENRIKKYDADFFGFYFSDSSAYDNSIDQSNTVNDIPMRWYTHQTNICIENVSLTLKRINNVAQLFMYDCNHCTISQGKIQNASNGIILMDTTAITINGLSISNCSTGIQLSSARETMISDSMISGNYRRGIDSKNSVNMVISNNIIIDNDEGITLYNVSYTTISENRIENNQYIGIDCDFSNDVSIRNNVIINNLKGIILNEIVNLSVCDNELSSNGLTISCDDLNQWISYTIKDNFVNNQPLRFYKQRHHIDIPINTAQVILVDCQKITMENLELNHVDLGIQLAYSSECTIFNCTLHGIKLIHSKCNIIQANTITKDTPFGISLYISSDQNIISHNIITHHESCGIYLSHSQDNILSDNRINNNNIGVCIYNSNKNTISNNIIESNSYYGIKLDRSSENIISDNQINKNKNGVDVTRSSDRNVIVNNNINENNYGIVISSSRKNYIKKNNFIDNQKSAFITVTIDKMNFERWRPIRDRNTFYKNYWGKILFRPKPIIGEIWVHVHDHLGGTYIYPWIFYDWHPRKIPFLL